MLCNIELKNVEINHSFYFAKNRFFCPFCKARATHKTKKYASLKALGYHLSKEHQNDRIGQLTLSIVQQIMLVTALEMQIGLLDCIQKPITKPTMFPRVRRFFDEVK